LKDDNIFKNYNLTFVAFGRIIFWPAAVVQVYC